MSTYTYWPWDDHRSLSDNILGWTSLPASAAVIKEARERLFKEMERLARYDEIDQQEEDGGNV